MLAHVVRHNNWANATLLEFCREVERRTVDELRTIARATGDRLLRIVESEDPDRRVEVNESRTSTVGVILAQCAHHGNEHRTQATTILGANGLVPPPISGWGYGRDSGISDVEE